MRFRVGLPGLDGADSTLHALDGVLRRVELGVHLLELPDADLLEAHPWYQAGTGARQKMLMEAARETTYAPAQGGGGPHARVHEVADPVSAARAERLANTPLTVVVENDASDRALLNATVRALGPAPLVRLWDLEVDPPAVDVSGPGGNGEVMKKVQRLCEEARRRDRPARIFVLVDSDGEVPGERKTSPATVLDGCGSVGVPVHVLRKRTAESYIPDGVWRSLAAAHRATLEGPVAALLCLGPAQRDHVNLDKGAPWNPTNAAAAALFAGVSAEDERQLTANLKGRGETMRILALVQPEHAPDADDLRARDGAGELDMLLAMIAAEL